MTTISQAHLNAYLRRRQRLASRLPWDSADFSRLPIGIYGTAPVTHLSFLARYDNFSVHHLDEALYAQRSLVRIQAMRRSVFVIPTALMPLVYQANCTKHIHELDRFLRQARVSPAAYQQAAQAILNLLAAQTLTTAEMKRRLQPLPKPVEQAFADIIRRLCAEGLLVRGRIRGSWRSAITEYQLVQDWLPTVDLHQYQPAEAQMMLARLYFDSYGPATRDDFQWWTHWPPEQTQAALDALAPELASVHVDNSLEGEYLLLQQDLDALHATPAADPDALDLLPAWDGYLMGYTQRERYLAPTFADRLVDRGGNVAPAILRAGAVAGVWDIEEDRDTFTFKAAFFGKLPKKLHAALRTQAERLYRAIHPDGQHDLRLLDSSPAPSLIGASQNRFQSPLREIEGMPFA